MRGHALAERFKYNRVRFVFLFWNHLCATVFDPSCRWMFISRGLTEAWRGGGILQVCARLSHPLSAVWSTFNVQHVTFILKAPTSASSRPLPPPWLLQEPFLKVQKLNPAGGCTHTRLPPRRPCGVHCSVITSDHPAGNLNLFIWKSLFFMCLSLPRWLQLLIHQSNQLLRALMVMTEQSRSSCFLFGMHF